MIKKLVYVVITILMVFLVLYVFKETIIKTIVGKEAEQITGLKLHMSEIEAEITKPVIEMKKLKLYNPKGFKDRVMIDIPEVYIDYDLKALLKKKVYLNELVVTIKEFTVIKNADGEMNLGFLKITREDASEEASVKPVIFNVNKLRLKVEKVVYKDYSSEEAKITEFNVGVDEVYRDIANGTVLARIIVEKSLEKTSVPWPETFGLGPKTEQKKEIVLKRASSGAGAWNVEQPAEAEN
ncbi:MAG: AsmA family protein [Candidatus Omnitrophica bacterium]|nr:AsmA family protein [Candidatus Omnitrophota bacterium]